MNPPHRQAEYTGYNVTFKQENVKINLLNVFFT